LVLSRVAESKKPLNPPHQQSQRTRLFGGFSFGASAKKQLMISRQNEMQQPISAFGLLC
jgi:alpha/beta superfamily hydrolase